MSNKRYTFFLLFFSFFFFLYLVLYFLLLFFFALFLCSFILSDFYPFDLHAPKCQRAKDFGQRTHAPWVKTLGVPSTASGIEGTA